MTIKNRGALSNPEGRFETQHHESYDDGWHTEEEPDLPFLKTTLMPEDAKTIISHNDSPDLSFSQSINPYRGCEHGCIYCYARPSHAYMNLSPGLDFETKIFYKVDAHKRLEADLKRIKPEQVTPIVLGANTDPYQPAEIKLKITRQILEVLNRYHHPVSIITKNNLITRDLDILQEMNERALVSVAISLTTLRLDLKRSLEPRTSSPQARLRAMESLTTAGIPVRVMAAPMIPLINDMELERILALSAQAGANYASFVLVRLPYEVKDLFKEWLHTYFPERATHVMSIIKQMRGGKEYDSSFGQQMRGQGQFANLLAQRFNIACQRYRLNSQPAPSLNCSDFVPPATNQQQLDLWS